MKLKYIALSLGTAAFMMSGCNGFLDKLPDERTEIDTEDKVVQLLIGAYPDANYQWVGEINSDNLIDNQAPHLPSNPNDKQITSHYNYSAYNRADDELFRFDPATSAKYSDSDSPGRIWSGYYNTIAYCNFALEAIEKLTANGKTMSSKLKAARAEALLLRAYSHFMLVNIFSQAYKDETQSKQDIGIPYVTKPETTVHVDYDRGNVYDTYQKIQADLEAGLADISDENYTAPKWHFNVNASHAFAARFYLYTHQWDKVVEHANKVLGTDNNTLKNMMMDYSVFTDCASSSDYGKAWQHPDRNNNLMLLTTYSLYSRRCFGYRYSMAGPAAREALMIHSSNLWSGYICTPIAIVSGMLFSSSSSDYGFFTCKVAEEFEYTDKIAGIGYAHIITRAFTANNLLLERAEAKIMLKNYEGAQEDLMAYWNNSIESFSEADKKAYVEAGYIKYMTPALLKARYSTAGAANCFDNWDFVTTNISSSYVIPAEAVPYMNCLNDFRRFENVAEGLRYFDIKRWGMELTHNVSVNSIEYKLEPKDTRRAIEVPWEAMSAGMASSRTQVSASSSRPAMSMPSDDALRAK